MDIFDELEKNPLKKENCFLCNNKLTPEDTTKEHVFPKWLLGAMSLWTERLTLLNGTCIQYKNILIPCCSNCNNYILGRLERDIETAFRGGFSEFHKLDRRILFQWLSIIFYQILYCESFLKKNIRDASDGVIVDYELLKEMRMFYIFIQSIRKSMTFQDPPPWSIFIYQTQTRQEERENFDFLDDVGHKAIAIRMNDIGIIACLQDNNAHERSFSSDLNKYKDLQLNDLQFRELAAMIFYKNSLLNRNMKYLTGENNKGVHEVISISPQGASSKPMYDHWVTQDYAQFLSYYMACPLEDIFQQPDKVITWLRKEDGGLNHF